MKWVSVKDELPLAVHVEENNFGLSNADREIIFKNSDEKKFIGYFIEANTILNDNGEFLLEGFWAESPCDDDIQYIQNITHWAPIAQA